MKIVQIVTNLNIGDAIGNDILAIDDALTNAGYTTEIMAMTIHEALKDRGKSLDFRMIGPDDLILFHKATGDVLTNLLAAAPCQKVLIYHNITPAKYFLLYDSIMAWNLWKGRRQLKKLSGLFDYGWGDSAFNCRELAEAGFSEDRLSVLPILYDPADHKTSFDSLLDEKLKGQKGTKILFIGRIASNKKQEEIIKVYDQYLHTVDPEARLYLVGSWDGMEKYYAKLKGFAWELGLSDEQVVFTGHVSETEKESYLRNADVFLCMSEHEGFCVPILEAMSKGVPVVAYAAAAVPETLGENGLLFHDRDYAHIVSQIDRLQRDQVFRTEVLRRQQENLSRFDICQTRKKLLQLVYSVLEGKK